MAGPVFGLLAGFEALMYTLQPRTPYRHSRHRVVWVQSCIVLLLIFRIDDH